MQLSGFFRTYNLSLYSNFGDGLIRQSEFRTVAGGNGNYIRRVNRHLTVMAGMDYLREAPRRDDLDRYLSTNPYVYGPFQQVTANDITINLVSPFIAVDGSIARWLRYNLGWRRDQIGFDNTDLLFSANSFHRWVGINSPKATLAMVAPDIFAAADRVAELGTELFHQRSADRHRHRAGQPGEPGARVASGGEQDHRARRIFA